MTAGCGSHVSDEPARWPQRRSGIVTRSIHTEPPAPTRQNTEPTEAKSSADVQRLVEFLRARDVACPMCRYNLRGIRPRGKCPECGFRAMPSVRARALVWRDVRLIERGYFFWRVVRAVGLVGLSIIVCVLICMLSCRVLCTPYFLPEWGRSWSVTHEG